MTDQIVHFLVEVGKGACVSVVFLVVFLFIVVSRSDKE